MTAAGQTARTWALQAKLFHRDVAVLAYGGTATFELGIVVELFGRLRDELKHGIAKRSESQE